MSQPAVVPTFPPFLRRRNEVSLQMMVQQNKPDFFHQWALVFL